MPTHGAAGSAREPGGRMFCPGSRLLEMLRTTPRSRGGKAIPVNLLFPEGDGLFKI